MTASDWVGMILTLVIFVLMVIAYVYAYRPKNKEKLEARKYLLDDGERLDSGDKNGG
jgi:cytochrome c oxidase cbb3-type subunit 4